MFNVNSIKHLLFDLLPFEAFSIQLRLNNHWSSKHTQHLPWTNKTSHDTAQEQESMKTLLWFIIGFTSHAKRRGNNLSEAGQPSVSVMVTSLHRSSPVSSMHQRWPNTHRYSNSHVHGPQSINTGLDQWKNLTKQIFQKNEILKRSDHQ